MLCSFIFCSAFIRDSRTLISAFKVSVILLDVLTEATLSAKVCGYKQVM